jgi:hypothetical protein
MMTSNLIEVYEVNFVTNPKLEIPYRRPLSISDDNIASNFTFNKKRAYSVKDLVNLIFNVHESPHETYSVEHAAVPILEELIGYGQRHEKLQLTLPFDGEEITVIGKPDLTIKMRDFNVIVEHKGIHVDMIEREFRAKSRCKSWWGSLISSTKFERHVLQSLIYASMESLLKKAPTIPVIAYTPYTIVNCKAIIYAVMLVYPGSSFSPCLDLPSSLPAIFGKESMEWLLPEEYLLSVLRKSLKGRAR